MILVVVEPHLRVLAFHAYVTSRPMVGKHFLALFLGRNPYRFSAIESAVGLGLWITERKYQSVFSVHKRIGDDTMVIRIESCGQGVVIGKGLGRIGGDEP